MREIDSIVPINEEHQRKLEQTKANLEKLNDRHRAEMAMIKVGTEISHEKVANVRELTQLKIACNDEIRDALFRSLDEQTALVRRIVQRVRGS